MSFVKSNLPTERGDQRADLHMLPNARRSLTRVLYTLVGVGLLPLSLFGIGSIWLAAEAQSDELKRTTMEISRALASGVEAKFDAEAAALAAVGRSPLLLQRDYAAFYTFAKEEASARPGWAGIILTDASGRMILKTTQPFGETDTTIADPESLAMAVRTAAFTVGSLSRGPAGRFAFPVRLPVKVDGQVAYVLTAIVRPDWALELLQKQEVPQDWVISVFDQKLRRIARSKDHERTLGGMPSPALQKLFLEEPSHRGVGLSRNLEGVDTFTGFARIASHGWVVGVGAPTTITSVTLSRAIGWHVLGIALSALACALLARSMALRIARAVHSARDGAVKLGKGESVAPERSGITELDEMTQAIARASAQLSAANAALKEALETAHKAGRAKDEFLAVLGHELRNPLAPMLTALHLLDMKGDAATVRERQILHRQLGHMRRLVDDLLDMSRIVSGKFQLERQPVDLSELVERAVESVPSSTERSRITVHLPNRPLWTDGDSVRLTQVLTNLLSNAMRYGNQGAVTIELDGNDQQVRLVVKDTGIGMSPETLAHVFEPFYQVPQMLERKSGGLGLGLAIVKSIVEGHGGSVTAQSEGEGLGSELALVLPAIAPPALFNQAPHISRAVTLARVLVVDDNVDALDTLVQALSMAGHTVRPALSPEDALTTVHSFSPEVAILDIGLPGMNGYELAEKIRDVLPSPVALVALTGYGQQADKKLAQEAGFDRHLVKPVDTTTLLAVVEELMTRRMPG